MTTLYEKRGRKYVPVQDTTACDGLTNGSWLITVQNGLHKCRRAVEDEKGLQMLAATTRWLEEWLAQELMKLSAYKHGNCSNAILSAKAKKVYQAWQEVMGAGSLMWMHLPSAMDVARAVCQKIRDETLQGKN
jgi:hypothetical protein